MDETKWTRDEVTAFAGRLGEFYADLSPAGQQIFADMLQDGVRQSEDVAGFAMTGAPIPGAAITAAVADYLVARAAD